MNVLALVGSPRKNGNTDILVDRVLDGAVSAGCIVEKVFLHDLTVLPCSDCRKCKIDSFACATRDDMQLLYSKIAGADVLVFETPLYWFDSTSQMKRLIDRLRPFGASKKLRSKKVVLIVPSRQGKKACKHMVAIFKLTLNLLEVQLVKSLLIKAYEKGEVEEQQVVLKKAFTTGKSMIEM